VSGFSQPLRLSTVPAMASDRPHIELRISQAMDSTRAERLGCDSVFPVWAPQFDGGEVMDGWHHRQVRQSFGARGPQK
jgi:hypothetical protein